MKPRFRAQWEVSSEELCILANWFLSPMSKNSATIQLGQHKITDEDRPNLDFSTYTSLIFWQAQTSGGTTVVLFPMCKNSSAETTSVG